MPPVTNATVDVQKMDLTPVIVKYKGLDLGGTLGNATIQFKYEKADIMADQLGKTILDKRVSGMMVTVTTEITEIQDMDKLKAVFPNFELVASGGSKMVRMANQIGASDYDTSGLLNLHPMNKASNDFSQDWSFSKARPTEESEIVYGPAEQAKMKIVWQIYPDLGIDGYPMFIHGDPTIGVVPASAGAAVAGGGNTGNGTVGSIAVISGATKSETITLTCVGVPSANHANFSVSGSLSGPLGIAQVGVGFSSPVITFTIADGATDFVIGDTFTIATTSANYT